MQQKTKTFKELATEELFEIYKLRTAVFVVEQDCAYQEVDDADKEAIHMWLEDEDGIIAYLRILPRTDQRKDASLGRVIAVKRRIGLGEKIVLAALDFIKKELKADSVRIEAQTYAKRLYEKVGFVQTSEEFLEDGIPHIEMKKVFN